MYLVAYPCESTLRDGALVRASVSAPGYPTLCNPAIDLQHERGHSHLMTSEDSWLRHHPPVCGTR